MATMLDNDRLNIRIEIKNNVSQPMEIDEVEDNKSEEEGEIRETLLNGRKQPQTVNNMHIQDKRDVRRNIGSFLDLDHKKLEDRAKRFSLKPHEMNSFTEQDLHDLYTSLGITSENVEQIRFEAVHLRSSDELTLEDVSSYFSKYSPINVEIIDDESYNVVWENKLTAARALFLSSEIVKGMPVRSVSEHVIDNFILDDLDSNKEIGLQNESRQVELIDDSAQEYKSLLNKNSVDISVINIPIPPGYWRLGKENINSYSVLLRFSMTTDKKPQLVEKCSKYSRSNTMKDYSSQQNKGIFSRNKDIHSDTVNKDPWGILAKNWNEDYKFREQERFNDNELVEEEEEPLPQIPKNPELRVRLTAKRRLGKKQEEDIKESSSEKEQSEESDQENVKKVSKVPRMRMYADEEEEKIKRRKLLTTLKKQSERMEKTEIANSDLRNILRITNRKSKLRADFNEGLDLSLNLQNRRNKLVFSVAQDSYAHPSEKVRNHLDKIPKRESRPKSPIRFERRSPEVISRSRREHIEKKPRDSTRRPHRRRLGGEMYSTRDDHQSSYSHKPKSKVALVIKTQKKPSVASAIRSRSRKFDTSSSEKSSSSESSSSSEESSEETDSSTSEDSDSSRNQRAHHIHDRRLGSNQLRSRVKNDFGRK